MYLITASLVIALVHAAVKNNIEARPGGALGRQRQVVF